MTSKPSILLLVTSILLTSAAGHRMGRTGGGGFTGTFVGGGGGGGFAGAGAGAFAGAGGGFPGFARPGSGSSSESNEFVSTDDGFHGTGFFAGFPGFYPGNIYAPQFPFGGGGLNFGKFFSDFGRFTEGLPSERRTPTGFTTTDPRAFENSVHNHFNGLAAAQHAFAHNANSKPFHAHNHEHGHHDSVNFVASGGGISVGPEGIRHTSFHYPGTPSKEPVVKTFKVPSGPGHVVGFSTSSFSGSSNINGDKKSHHEGVTIIQNGDDVKVIKY